MNTLTDNHAQLRGRLAGDVYRPRFHFAAPANWLNDPNGLVQANGVYHLFYQHNPFGPGWGNMHWGHATSRDLLHWRDQPVALHPTPGGPDENGCFSGSAVHVDGRLKLFYTGVTPQCQCIADSDASHTDFVRQPGTAAIPTPPPGYTGDFRDPYVFRYHGRWHMIVGCGDAQGHGALLLYRSTDLDNWQYVGPMIGATSDMPEPFRSTRIYECPTLLPMHGKWVLVMSCLTQQFQRAAQVPGLVGRFDGTMFHVEHHSTLDGGQNYYAPQGFIDEQGRAIMMAWLSDTRPGAAWQAAGWNGLMTVPRVVDMDAKGRLTYRPVPELRSLREQPVELSPRRLFQSMATAIDTADGQSCELDLAIEMGKGGIELAVRCDPLAMERTIIRCSAATGLLSIDTTHSSLMPGCGSERSSVSLVLDPGEPLRLRVLIDTSIIEVFANDRACIAARCYPIKPASTHCMLTAHESDAYLAAGHTYALRSVW